MGRTWAWRAATALTVSLILTSCQGQVQGPSIAPSHGAATPSSPAPSVPSPTSTAKQEARLVSIGATTVSVPAQATVEPVDEATVTISFHATAGSVSLRVEGASTLIAGRVVGEEAILSRPIAVGADAQKRPLSFTGEGPDYRLEVPDGGATVTLYAGTTLVEGAEWESEERVFVYPTKLGRSLAPGDPLSAAALAPELMREVIALHPSRAAQLNSPSSLNQLACHMVGAPDKASWNLETDRPDKGLIGFMRDRCN